jgi:hypothetical protein
MKARRSSCFVGVVLAFFVPTSALSQITYIPTDMTIDFTFGNILHVGKDGGSRDSSPAVSIIGGGDIWQSVFVFNSSNLTISGGRVRESVVALDTSTVNLTEGEVGGSLATGQEGTPPRRGGTILMTGGTASYAGIDRRGTFSMHGGTLHGPVAVSRGSTFYLDGRAVVGGYVGVGLDSQAYISGGTVTSGGVTAISNGRVSMNGGKVLGTVSADGAGTVSMTGGQARFVHAAGAGTVTMGGGITEVLSAKGEGLINLAGGGLEKSFYTDQNSKGNIYSGSIGGDVTAYGDTTINIYGGTIGGTINAFGTINIYGSIVSGKSSFARIAASEVLPDLFAIDDGAVQLIGSGLKQTLVDSNVAYDQDGITGIFSKYELTGALADGTDITGTTLFVQNGSGATFALITAVPEPETYALMALGLLVVLGNTRRKIGARCPA